MTHDEFKNYCLKVSKKIHEYCKSNNVRVDYIVPILRSGAVPPVVKAIHGYNPLLKNGGQVFENVGYIIDDGKYRLYTTSDTICFKNDYKADVVALPVTGYGLTMSAFEASLFSQELGAKLVLSIHMDNEKYPTDLEYMKKNFDKFNINYKVLNIEETIEINF